jgi:glutaredoxin
MPHRKRRRFIVFVGPKCPYCKPVTDLVTKACLGLGIDCEIIDATQHPARAAHFNVQGTPTVLLFKGEDKIPLRWKTGKLSASELEKWMAETNGG